MYPEFIFEVIVLIVFIYLIFNILRNRGKLKILMWKVIISILILGFSWIWFVPIHVGQRGESPVCKFRFQVFEYDTHDYSGNGNITDLFFKSVPEKYGMIDLYTKIGGWKEYFGLKSFEYETDEQYFGKFEKEK